MVSAAEYLPATPVDRLDAWLGDGRHVAVSRYAGRYLAVAYTTASDTRSPAAHGYGSTAVEALEALARDGVRGGEW